MTYMKRTQVKFIMMVVVTSLAPRCTRRNSGTTAAKAPATSEPSRAMIITIQPGAVTKSPMTTAASAPSSTWPWPPMLKKPVRRGMSTARPVSEMAENSARVASTS
jgi:hypothetical protein